MLLAIDELRELAQGIHPAVLTERGLAHALESIAARSTVPIELRGLPATRFDETAEATAYYVVAEAITNAQRYAQRRRRSGSASAVAQRGLHVEIGDDGIGGAVESRGLRPPGPARSRRGDRRRVRGRQPSRARHAGRRRDTALTACPGPL